MSHSLEETAKFYGIDMDEAVRRQETVMAQGDNPQDPICVGCAKRPNELDMDITGYHSARQLVIQDDGTYNPRNGHFLCNRCYILNGMPTAPGGWKCP